MEIATLIDDRYQLIKQIGQGGMSKVYLALDRRLNKEWAIKVIDNQLIINQALAEAELMKKIDHHLLPRIVDVINTPKKLYIVMDYIKGVTLDRVIERYGSQSEKQVIDWTRQICRILHYLHQQDPPIIHCDLKPENIILKQDGTIRLVDLGIASEIDAENKSLNRSWATKAFAAPEQFKISDAIDERTDVYCLGITMLYLLTGEKSIGIGKLSDSILKVDLKLDADLNWIIQKAVQKKPIRRYSSILALAKDLKRYQSFKSYKLNQLRGKWFRFCTVVCIGLLSLTAGVLSLKYQSKITNDRYHNYLKQAQMTTNSTKQLIFYQQAIQLQPKKQLAYQELLTYYRQDDIFTEKEMMQFTEMLLPHNNYLRPISGYGELAFQLAVLCWYDYERPDQRIVKSEYWLKIAKRYTRKNGDLYFRISQYQQLATGIKALASLDLNTNSSYLSYWQSLTQLHDAIFNFASTDVWHLFKVENLMITSLEQYLSDFKSNGISATTLIARIEDICVHLDGLAISDESAIQTRQALEMRLDNIKEKIFLIY